MRLRTCFSAAACVFLCSAAVSQDAKLPHIVTSVSRPERAAETVISGAELASFSSVPEALESAGFSFRGVNSELSFHGYWNASIKVYINNVLMNDPNTGTFDFDTLDIQTVRSVRIDPASSDGAVSVYISTFAADYGAPSARASASSKSYIGSFNDSFSAGAGFSFPLLFDSGSALFVQEDMSAVRSENSFGYRSREASYRPDLSDSYTKCAHTYTGYNQTLVNNSLLASYSSARFPGASFGFSSYISLSDQGCGSEGGYYFSDKNQQSISAAVSLPVFLPFEPFSLNILPSYAFSNLDYTEKGRFSFLENECTVRSCSIQLDAAARNFFRIYANASYGFSEETAKQSEHSETASHSLFTCFASPSVQLEAGGCSISLAFPVSYFHPSRALSFLYSLTVSRSAGSLSFFAKASRSVTNPVFQQLYYSGDGGTGNPSLKPESAVSFCTGVSYSSMVKAEVKPFLIFYRDKISWTQDKEGSWSPENAGSSVNCGADVSFSTHELFSFFTLKAQYTLCRARLASGRNKGNQIMLTPVHSLFVSAEVPLPLGFLWNASFRYASGKYTDNSNSSRVPDFFSLDTGLSWKAGCAALSLEWKNMLDFQYCHADGYPSPGTSLALKAKFLWQ